MTVRVLDLDIGVRPMPHVKYHSSRLLLFRCPECQLQLESTSVQELDVFGRWLWWKVALIDQLEAYMIEERPAM